VTLHRSQPSQLFRVYAEDEFFGRLAQSEEGLVRHGSHARCDDGLERRASSTYPGLGVALLSGVTVVAAAVSAMTALSATHRVGRPIAASRRSPTGTFGLTGQGQEAVAAPLRRRSPHPVRRHLEAHRGAIGARSRSVVARATGQAPRSRATLATKAHPAVRAETPRQVARPDLSTGPAAAPPRPHAATPRSADFTFER
jgi:hypothetical protein